MKTILLIFAILMSFSSFAQWNTNIIITDFLCQADSSGAAMVQVTGGTPAAYIWSNGQTTATATGLSEGYFWVEVLDSAGATVAIDTVLMTVPQISTTSTDETCYFYVDGTATAIMSDSTRVYTYIWRTSLSPATFSISAQTLGLAANVSDINGDGNEDTMFYYIVIVSDAHGCVYRDSAYVRRPSLLTPTLINNYNGTATASVTGGTAPYFYQWDVNAGNQTTATATGLSNAVYHITITDSHGCYTLDSLSVINNIDKIIPLERFDIFPNPSEGHFEILISFQQQQFGKLEIRNVLGQLIDTKEFEGKDIQYQISLDNKVDGIYFVSLNLGGEIITRKIRLLNSRN